MNAADEKALEAYRGNQAGLSLESPYVDKAFLAGRASRNSEVEGLREAVNSLIELCNHGVSLYAPEMVGGKARRAAHDYFEDGGILWKSASIIGAAEQALTKGDSDASRSP